MHFIINPNDVFYLLNDSWIKSFQETLTKLTVKKS